MQKLLVFDEKKGLLKSPRPEEISSYLEAGALVWLDLEQPEESDLEVLRKVFRVHPLVLEELNTKASLPKIFTFAESSFIIWQKIYLLIGASYLVTIHEKEVPVLARTLDTYRRDPALFAQGTGMMTWTILDGLVDETFLLLDTLSDELDALEDKMFGQPTQADVKRLFALKREMLMLRRMAAPEREIINSILRRELPYFPSNLQAYFEDLYDHLVRIIDLVDTFRDVLSGAMQLYLSNISNRLNIIMKTLTIVATIMMPATLISSIYGMNVRLPLAGWPAVFWAIMAVMGGIGLAMVYYAWWRKWL